MSVRNRYYVYNPNKGEYLKDLNGLKLTVSEEGKRAYHKQVPHLEFSKVDDGHEPKRSIKTFSGGWNELD